MSKKTEAKPVQSDVDDLPYVDLDVSDDESERLAELLADDAPVEESDAVEEPVEELSAVDTAYYATRSMSISFLGEKYQLKKDQPVEDLSSEAAAELLKAGMVRR